LFPFAFDTFSYMWNISVLPVHWDKTVIVVINEVRVSEYEKW
nr:hypothetical protein [Tanacetum cinerariifolium]